MRNDWTSRNKHAYLEGETTEMVWNVHDAGVLKLMDDLAVSAIEEDLARASIVLPGGWVGIEVLDRAQKVYIMNRILRKRVDEQGKLVLGFRVPGGTGTRFGFGRSGSLSGWHGNWIEVFVRGWGRKEVVVVVVMREIVRGEADWIEFEGTMCVGKKPKGIATVSGWERQ